MRIQTALTRLVGIEHPVVQTGMGCGRGATGVGDRQHDGLGILASATMTIDELATAITKVKSATDKPFGVNIRADAADAGDRVDLMIRELVKVASFALAPKAELIARLKEAGAVVVPCQWCGQARQEGRRVGRRHGDRAGRRRWRAHRSGGHHPAAALGLTCSTARASRWWRPAGSSTAADWLRRCPTGPPVSRWAPGSC